MENKIVNGIPLKNISLIIMMFVVLLFLQVWSDFQLQLYAQEPQNAGSWSHPIDLAEGREGGGSFPFIFTDLAGGVHVFWDEAVRESGGIKSWVTYAYWNGAEWSNPIDVFIGSEPWRNVWGAQAVVDRNGVMHTIWIDAFELKYAQRHISSPVSARSWSESVTLPTWPGRRTIGPAAIALDDAGILHVIYLHADIDVPGVYYLRSEDKGANWDEPVLISEQGVEDWPLNQLHHVMDLLPINNTLHAAWEQPSVVVAYAQGRDNGQDWSVPTVVPGDHNLWPTLVDLDSRLLLLTTGQLPGGQGTCLKIQNTSLDQGKTWTETQQIGAPARGCLFKINVVEDGDGGYHLITGGRVNFTTALPGIWYSNWGDGRWNTSQEITWPGLYYDTLGTQADAPSAVISEGNILHVVFHVDEGRIWYTRRLLSASRVQPIELPQPTKVTTRRAQVELVTQQSNMKKPIPTATRLMTPLPPQLRSLQFSDNRSGAHPALIGALSAMIVLVLAVSLSQWRRGR